MNSGSRRCWDAGAALSRLVRSRARKEAGSSQRDLKTIFDIEAVTMANLIPWGSKTTEAFHEPRSCRPCPVAARHGIRGCAQRQVIAKLNPKLLIVPLSVERAGRWTASEIGVSMARRRTVVLTIITTERAFTFILRCSREADQPSNLLRHPAAVRKSRKRIVHGVSEVLGSLCAFSLPG
jgi:hypothetical protein